MNTEQRTDDEVTIKVAATVHTIDEALTWIVRQLDSRPLEGVSGEFNPVWVLPVEGGPAERYYEVTISGTEVTP